MSSCHVPKCSFSFEFRSFCVHQTKPSSKTYSTLIQKTTGPSGEFITLNQIAIPCEDIFSMANPQSWEHHYLGSDTRHLRGNTDSKHRKQVIQGKGTFEKPYSQKPYAHMHVQQEGSRIFLCLNVQGEIHLQRQVNFPLLFTRSMKRPVFFTTKLLCQRGTVPLP